MNETSTICSALHKLELSNDFSLAEKTSLVSAACLAAPPGSTAQRVAIEILRDETKRAELDQSSSTQLVEQGIVDVTMEILQTASELHVVADGVACLANLAACSGLCKSAVVSAGGVTVLLRLILHDEPKICTQALRALGNLTYGFGEEVEDAKSHAIQADACEGVVKSMRMHVERADVARWGAHAMRNFSVRHHEMQMRLVTCGALDVLLLVLDAHGHAHPKVAEFCFAALAFVSDNHSTHLLQGCFVNYTSVMHSNIDQDGVQQYGCLALSFAMQHIADNAEAALQQGVLHAIADAMNAHCSAPQVQRWGATAACHILACVGTRAAQLSIGIEHEVGRISESLEKAKATHKNKKVCVAVERAIEILPQNR